MSPRVRLSLTAALVLAFLTAVYLLRIRTGMADFAVNYRAGERLAAGETLYQTADGHFMFKYLPVSALLYLPLSALPLEAAKAVWFTGSLVALAGVFAVIARLVPQRRGSVVLVLSGLILAKYLLHELRLGQINILVTLVMLATVHAVARSPGSGAEARAGALAGLAIALKPYAALLVPYLVITRRLRGLAALGVTLLALLTIPAAFYGVGGNLLVLRQWAHTLSQSTPTLLTNNDNVSIVAFFTKWLGEPARALVPTAVVLGLLAILTFVVVLRGRREPSAAVLDGALLLTLIPLVSPLGWDYTFLMALLAVALILRHWTTFPRAARWILGANFAVIALAIYDILGPDAYAAYMQWSVTTVNFVGVVAALAYLRLARVC